MFYYLVIMQNPGEGSTQAVYKYNNIDDALSAYHAELAYRNTSRLKTTCVILDEFGNSVYKEAWQKYVAPEQTEGS